MPIVEYEYSGNPPPEAAERQFTDGEPILYAYECVLLERENGDQFVYTAVNLNTGFKEVLSRRMSPLTTSEVGKMVERMRLSKIAGASRLQADRPEKNRIGKNKIREIMEAVFRRILPQNGYAVREEQISLSHGILGTIERRGVTLAEAETGTGKTEGYLIPAILAKRGRLNDAKNADLYPDSITQMPIVIATSSIALQRAILTEYIPRLSQMLLDGGVIKEPLSAVLRKGKEHYICKRNLKACLPFEANPETRRMLEELLLPNSIIDLSETELPPHIKHKISVKGRCTDICRYKKECPYLAYRENAQSAKIDIQVCNHNYLLADTLMRANRGPRERKRSWGESWQSPLIPNYQTLVIDEAHKFIDAARTMYGTELSSEAAPEILKSIERHKLKREGFQNPARQAAAKLFSESIRLFKGLETSDSSVKKTVEIDREALRHLRNIRDISVRLMFYLRGEAFFCKTAELLSWVSRKYSISTSGIDLKELLSESGEDDGGETQRELMRSQAVKLYQAICVLPEIRRKAELEREQRIARRFTFNAKNDLLETIRKRVRLLLPVERASGIGSDLVIKLIWRIQELHDKASAFANQSQCICWLEQEDNADKLCSVPSNLNERLFRDRWSKGIPTIFTSGTLSAVGDFTRIKQSLGLDRLGSKLTETTHSSPFDYRENVLLYISEHIPFPNSKNKKYLPAITGEIEKLVTASCGHAAVLFTSYDTMGRVYAELSKRELPFPMFRLDKGGIREIERFKTSGNGMLFASGALWEGIDIPGDSLSMLIIVKLPFQIPDAISEYERKQYPDFRSYLNSVLVPEMLIKLKQGFGRLIRSEGDSGCVAILDSRANYRERILDALPECRLTNRTADIVSFFKEKKPPEYFDLVSICNKVTEGELL